MASRSAVHVTASMSVYQEESSDGDTRCVRVQRFATNAALQAALKQVNVQRTLLHANICRIYDVREEELALTVQMEWCGLPLARYTHAWSQEDCWYLLYYVTVALAYAQTHGIIHGNVTPDTIYRTEKGEYKVAYFVCPDFGLGEEYLAGIKTPFCMSPEVKQQYATLLLLGAADRRVDLDGYKADVYSFALTLTSLFHPSVLSAINPTSLDDYVASLPLHEEFQLVLLRMFAFTEADRPDWQELLFTLQALIQAPAQSVTKSPIVRARKTKVLPKPCKPQSTDSASASKPTLCQSCGKSFALDKTESWRLDLLGSVQFTPAEQYCSQACFSQSLAEPESPSSPLTSLSQSSQRPVATQPRVINVSLSGAYRNQLLTQKPFRQFYHCFRHHAVQPYAQRTTPYILPRCPECPPGSIQTQLLQPLQVTATWNSLYPSLVFVEQTSIYSGKTILLSVDVRVVDSLTRAVCHVCNRSVQSQEWICFFHAEKPEIVCSVQCLTEGALRDECVACGARLPYADTKAQRVLVENKLKGRVMTIDPNCCDLCQVKTMIWTLSCRHHFCLDCFALIPDYRDVDEFSCLFCGQIMTKKDHQQLMEMLGRL